MSANDCNRLNTLSTNAMMKSSGNYIYHNNFKIYNSYSYTSSDTSKEVFKIIVTPDSDYTDSYLTSSILNMGILQDWLTARPDGIGQHRGEPFISLCGTRRSNDATVETAIRAFGVYTKDGVDREYLYRPKSILGSDGNNEWTLSFPEKTGTFALLDDVGLETGDFTLVNSLATATLEIGGLYKIFFIVDTATYYAELYLLDHYDWRILGGNIDSSAFVYDAGTAGKVQVEGSALGDPYNANTLVMKWVKLC